MSSQNATVESDDLRLELIVKKRNRFRAASQFRAYPATRFGMVGLTRSKEQEKSISAPFTTLTVIQVIPKRRLVWPRVRIVAA